MLVAEGFSAQKVGEVDIVVAELTSNLVKHADHGGEVIFRLIPDKEDKIFEIFCIDQGPGTNNIQEKLVDGISSTNTLGQGLGAIKRLTDFFQIYSMNAWGTITYCRKHLTTPAAVIKRPIIIKVIQQPIRNEKVCGDGYSIIEKKDETRIFVGDGLGHGPHALEAVQEAIAAFKECNSELPSDILRYIHERVRKTRGLVGTIAILDHSRKKWIIGGIGNISTRIIQGIEYKNYTPHNGIIGLNIPNTMNNHEIEAEKFQSIVMTSDGIQNKWNLLKYHGILKYDPAILAAAIFKDFGRKTDDMTVLIGKINL